MFRIGLHVLILGAMLLVLSPRTQSQGAQANGSASAPRSSASSIPSIESLIRSQHYVEAQQAIQSALLQTPHDARLFTLQGIVFSIQKQREPALAAFDRALSLSPNEPAALRGEAQLLYSAHDARAIPILERIIRSDPKDQTAREMRAILERRQGDCSAAIDDFRLAADEIHTHPESLEAYASCLFDTSEFDQAVPILQQLVSLLPDRTYPRYDLAVVLVRTRQYEAALKILEPLLNADASDADLLSLAADAYEHTGNTNKAVALARQAIVLEPGTAGYYTAFAELCLSHESYDVGIAMINAGITRIPANASLYLARGLLYAQLAQVDKAEADFNKAEQLDSGQSLSAYATDLAELESNHEEVALRNIRAQIKIHPESPLLHFILAKLLDNRDTTGENQISTEALQHALEAVHLKPDMVEGHDLLAAMYTRSGQNDNAIEQCRLALHYQPDDQAAIYHLLIALRHSGGGHEQEVSSLVARLSDLKRSTLNEETQRKRLKIVEQSGAANSP